MNKIEQLPVFVYGTLKRGHNNFTLMERAVTRTEEATLEDATMVGLGIPMVFRMPEDFEIHRGKVYGEVHWVEDSAFQHVIRRLDSLEGYNRKKDTGGYLRRKVTVTLENGEEVECWFYEGNPQHLVRYKEGGRGLPYINKSGRWPNGNRNHP